MKQQNAGGGISPGGQMSGRVVRDLGDLTGSRKAPLAWRLKNYLANQRKSTGQVVAAQLLGKVYGVVTLQPALAIQQFKPNDAALGLTPTARHQVTALLRSGVPMANIASLVRGAEGWAKLQAALRENIPVGQLAGAFGGQVIDFGIVSRRVVTNGGAGFIVDAFQNLVELENMKYHGLGTGNTAEAAGDSALVTELTTEYNPNSTRATGTTAEQSAQVYETVGTNTVDASAAVVEHGVFSAASAGVLLDRSIFSVVNLANGDSLQTTYRLTITSGS